MKKVVFLSLLVIIGILFTAQIRRGLLSLLVLADSVSLPEKSLMGRFMSGPSVQQVKIRSGSRVLRADLYGPQTKAGVPLLIAYGRGPAVRDDGRLVLFAQDLARAGFLVLVPDFEGMNGLRLRLSDAEDIVESFLYLTRLHDSPHGVMMGVSFGSGPLLLAAADPRIRDKVGVVGTVGGYFDLRNVLLFGLTGSFEYGGHRGYVRPQESIPWMLAYKNLDLLRSPPDREKLRKIIEQRNRYDLAGADLISRSLGPEGRAVYDFLANNEQERFAPLYENLPLSLREYVYQLSPSRAVRYIHGYFIIAHGDDDESIPYTESLRLADAVNDAKRVHLARLPQFMHVESARVSAGGGFWRYGVGGWRLFLLIYDLMEKSGV